MSEQEKFPLVRERIGLLKQSRCIGAKFEVEELEQLLRCREALKRWVEADDAIQAIQACDAAKAALEGR